MNNDTHSNHDSSSQNDDEACTFFLRHSRNNIFYGRNGCDNKFHGSTGNDTFYGGDRYNMFSGAGGNDTFYGGKGRNVFFGGRGDDTFYIDGTDNKVTGGPGKDKFVISPSFEMTSKIKITDFDVAEDSIDLRHFSNIKGFEDLKISFKQRVLHSINPDDSRNYIILDHTEISLTDKKVIILNDVKPSDLKRKHFIFNNTDFIDEIPEFFISLGTTISEEFQDVLPPLTPEIMNDYVSDSTGISDGWFF